MIPLFGVGSIPAMVALFVYSLLPIVRNTYAGIRGVDPELIEAADAIGLYSGTRLRLVELPLASRSILAGIKTSAVINVGTATSSNVGTTLQVHSTGTLNLNGGSAGAELF